MNEHHGTGSAPENAPENAPGNAPANLAGEPAEAALRAGSPQDILAFVPHCLGFEPQESLVLMTLHGKTLSATLRLDLPGPDADRRGPGSGRAPGLRSIAADYSARICSLLAGDTDADAVLMVVYTDRVWTAGYRAPYSGLAARLLADLGAQGLELRDGWLVGNGHWRDYFCASPGCCPWPGFPLDQVAGSNLNAELVYRGSAYAPTVQAAVGLPGGSPAGIVSDPTTAKSEADNRRRFKGRWTQPEHFARTLKAWDECFRGVRSSEHDGLLLASLESKPVRDAVLVLAALGLPAALAGSGHWLGAAECAPDTAGMAASPAGSKAKGAAEGNMPPDGSAEAGRIFRSVLIGQSSQAPDWDCLDRAHTAFTSLLRTASGEPAAALMTLLGWLEWSRGRSSRAALCLSGALQVAPGYRLAQLLRALLMRGELPTWSQSPRTAWRGGATG